MMDLRGRARGPFRAVFSQLRAQTAAKGLAALPSERHDEKVDCDVDDRGSFLLALLAMAHTPISKPCRGHLFHRTTMLVGKPAMDRLGTLHVAVFGVGGVGSWTAESLIRSGVEHLTIVDSDVVCSTNVNRQLQATALNVGNPKVDELRKRLLEINPQAIIHARQMVYNERTADQFDLRSFHYVIDAIDSLCNKVLLVQKCQEAGVTIYASMGAGAKLDPTQIKVAKLADTKMCPLARMVRKRLGRRKASADFLCVYSEEAPLDPATETLCGTGNCACSHAHPKTPEPDSENPDWCARKTRINGTAVHITAVFGFMLAGLVIQDVVSRSPIPSLAVH